MSRQSIASIAIITRPDAGGMRWLAQWNEKWQSFNFVSGHKESGETFRECIVREIKEELSLSETVDFDVSPAPRLHVEFTAFSKRAGIETDYFIEAFDVTICNEAAYRIIDQ